MPVILFMFLCPFLYFQNRGVLLSHLRFVSKEAGLSEHSVNLFFSGWKLEHKILFINEIELPLLLSLSLAGRVHLFLP